MTAYLGEIRLFAGDFAPAGWALCDGRELDGEKSGQELFGLLGTAFGGKGPRFNVPDLRGRVPVGAGTSDYRRAFAYREWGGAESVALTGDQIPAHTHAVQASTTVGTPGPAKHVWAAGGTNKPYTTLAPNSAISPKSILSSGGGQEHPNLMPYLALSFIISLTGPDPRDPGRAGGRRVGPDLGQITLFPIELAPEGWVLCDGRALDIGDHQALFSVIGTTFGGDGRRTFNVPDLRGRVPIHASRRGEAGSKGGAETHVLTAPEMPTHTHKVIAGSQTAVSTPTPSTRRSWGGSAAPFATTPNAAMRADALTSSGGGEAHQNMQPYAVLGFHLCVSGIFPVRP